MRKTAVSLLAHPDDAEILCAGTLARLAALGWKIHIVTATAGDCGSASLDAAEISRIRLLEARRAAEHIGATYHCLGELDGYVCYAPPVLRKVYDVFRAIDPDIVFTHALRDYMMDHEQVAQLGRAASFVYAAPNVSSSPCPKDASVPHLYYCDPIEGIDPLGHPVQPTTVIDIQSTQTTKLEMLAMHASQREWLARHHGMDQYLAAVEAHDRSRGALIGSTAAEAFVQHRGHAYPQDDLLKSLLS